MLQSVQRGEIMTKHIINAKCNDCGELVKSNQKFCPGCGAELDWSSLEDEPEEKPAKKATAKSEKATPKPAAKGQSIEELEQYAKGKLNKWLIIGGVSFLILFIVIGTTPDGEEPNGFASILLGAIVISIINIIQFAVSLSKYRKEKKK